VPFHERAEGARERSHVERAAQTRRERHVVGGAVGFEPIEEPQPLLRERCRQDDHVAGELGGLCQYAATTSAAGLIGVGDSGPRPLYQDCGASGNLTCDDIPWVADVVRALESCTTATDRAGGAIGSWVARGDELPAYGGTPAVHGTGAPPCEHIDPREVFVEGGSRGGGMTLDAVCDTRTSGLFAAATVVSAVMISPGAAASTPPNCPAMLPFDRSTCVADCVAATPNDRISLQFIWGDEDPNYPADTSYCDRTVSANDCPGVGFKAAHRWVLGNIPLARDTFGHAVLGCGPAPSDTATTGASGKITVTTYADGCHTPGVATQTIRVGSGGHMPETWPYGATSGITCTSDCVDYNGTGADGLVEPLAAWSFWTTYFR
jgi:poly(3-hydroxybutyrate) depolymerase